MDQKDKDILNAMQEKFPLEERPYLKLAEGLGISEKELLSRTQKLLDSGVIRRFGILINHKKLDYFSTLLGVKAKTPELKKGVIEMATARPEVTHCYERDGEYNVWFTFLTPDKKIFNGFLKALEAKYGADNILNLPTVKSHKLRTTFEV